MNSSTSSTQSYSPQSGSTPRNMQQAVTAASLPQPNNATVGNGDSHILEKWVIPIMGMILTGVIAYFAAFGAVKDHISDNKQNISILKNDYKHTNEKLSDIKETLSQTKNNKSEIMVLKTKVDNIEYNLREINKSNK